MRSEMTLGIVILLAAAAPGLLAQTKPPATAGAKSAPATPATAKPAPQTAKAPAKPTGKSKSKSASAAKPAAKKPVRTADSAAPAGAEAKLPRRDPFESLVGRQKSQADAAKNLPVGKAGLQVGTLRLDGIVRAPNGMIAVVTNPQARTYFLREGDQLYDGRVEKIAMDGVSFHEEGKDAFGKPVERQVNKRIYSSPGEQQ
jgi:Tfp pilus assembly protein PilP